MKKSSEHMIFALLFIIMGMVCRNKWLEWMSAIAYVASMLSWFVCWMRGE